MLLLIVAFTLVSPQVGIAWMQIPQIPNFVHNINKGTDYPFIQAAIDDASPSDEIRVESGTYYENVVINKQLTLRGIDTGFGMPVVDAGGSGSTITLSADGITLEGFEAINSGDWPEAGINISSNNNIVKGNKANNNSYHGICIRSNDNTIRGNTANGNTWYGIEVISSSGNTITDNTVDGNTFGIELWSSNDNTITSNTASSNGFGIQITWSSRNTIIGNTAQSNNHGIGLTASSNNIIYHNNLINNYGYNAYDGSSNQWDAGTEGNYYSDYTGTDSNNDGIGDTPYPIPYSSSVDRYPLMSPYTPGDSGLVAEWHFDEGSGNLLIDSSGNGNNGTIYGATWTTEGKFGSALQFDGMNDYVEIPDSPELSGGTGKNMTVEFWFKPNQQYVYGFYGCIVTKWQDVSYDWGAGTGFDEAGLSFSFYYGSYESGCSVCDMCFYGGTIQEGVWHHGAFTFEAESSPGANNAKLTLYLNGEKLDLTFLMYDHYYLLPNQLYDMPDTTAPVSIGYSGKYYNSCYFNGVIDEIKIYNRVLSADEIKAEYEKGTPPPTISIAVTSPDGGDDWQAGTTQTIQWSYTGNPGPDVKIELLKSGVLDQTIISSTPIGSGGTGSYNWTIPLTQTPNTDYQIRITSTTNNAYTDTSDGFTVSAPPLSVKITSPNNNDNFYEGIGIVLKGEASGGLAPFNYNWIIDGEAQNEDSNEFIKAGLAIGKHTVKLQVTDIIYDRK